MNTVILYPCKYIGITSGFQSSSRPSHKGVDLGWNRNYGGPNHEVLAPIDGIVTDIKSDVPDGAGTSYGNYILIKSKEDASLTCLVAHLKYGSLKVSRSSEVKSGQVIAKMGNTGEATGIHCHFEVRINNVKVNPINYTYATADMIIAKSTASEFNIKILDKNKFPDISGVDVNKYQNQLKVLINNLRIRKTPTLNENNQVGWVVLNSYYNYYQITESDGYTWYKIGDDLWLAYNSSWIEIYPEIKLEKDEIITSLEKQLKETKEEINNLKKELEDVKSYTFTYDVNKTSFYKINLKKGEKLLIK